MRPNPDELLDTLRREEAQRQRGRLKIFFGASAGVGKTFAMLQAARRRRDEGVDVVIGIVETHGRPETAVLLDGLEVLPPAQFEHRGRCLHEFDLDAALARRPQLILVDELAHSNVQGARHLKRWQDVHELLDAGIDVYTTVNVQHLESLNDVVGQITGIRVSETMPDRVFDLADEVTLVDLPAEELLDRLRDGKVYLAQQAEHAIRNFFRKGNLIALRELALRRTADRVDAQMREYRADRSIEPIWQARERLLVCVGPGPEAADVVRAAARLAVSLKADWIAAYVETPRLQKLSEHRRDRPLRALKLAQELGGESATLAGAEPVVMLLSYARVRNVSRLVVGSAAARAARSASEWQLPRLLHRPFSERIAAAAGDIDVTLVATGAAQATGTNRAQSREAVDDWRSSLLGEAGGHSPPRHYAIAALGVAAVSGVAAPLVDRVDLANIVMLYLLAVIFAAARLGRGPGVFASLASVTAFEFFFVPPSLSFAAADTQYLLTFAGMLLTSLVISHLTSSLRREARIASHRERRTHAMFGLTRELAAALTIEQIVEIAMRHIHQVFNAKAAILLPDSQEKVRQQVKRADQMAFTLAGDELDLDIGQWVYDQQKQAGLGTETLPAAHALYLPLKAPMRTRGVLALQPRGLNKQGHLGRRWAALAIPEQQRLLDTFAAQIALALERVHYVTIAQDALVNMESERLRNSLLSAISHDLRTPLTTIVGFSSMLTAGYRGSGGLSQAELADAIHEEAVRMTGLVTNLLEMARLQAGGVQLNRQWLMLEELIGSARRICQRTLAQYQVRVACADLPLLRLDAVLIERLFVNLFENAAKYTPAGALIQISAQRITDDGRPVVRVSVDDNGPGLPSAVKARVFDKFIRGEQESTKPGIGLGLAICRAIVNAHGGKIGAENLTANGEIAQPGDVVAGARFWFTLPADEPPPALLAPLAPEIANDIAKRIEFDTASSPLAVFVYCLRGCFLVSNSMRLAIDRLMPLL